MIESSDKFCDDMGVASSAAKKRAKVLVNGSLGKAMAGFPMETALDAYALAACLGQTLSVALSLAKICPTGITLIQAIVLADVVRISAIALEERSIILIGAGFRERVGTMSS